MGHVGTYSLNTSTELRQLGPGYGGALLGYDSHVPLTKGSLLLILFSPICCLHTTR